MITPIIYANESALKLFGAREEDAKINEDIVKEILEDIKQNGDTALKKYCKKFDGFCEDNLKVSEEEYKEAFAAVPKSYFKMLKRAIKNISAFHKKQLKKGFEIRKKNSVVGQKVTPVSCAGVYVPGGTAAYPSTVLMNVIPAKIAGVKNVVMVTPVKADGKVKPEVLVAARLCGADSVFKIGGAQAIAALAYGTETVPKADKITGPGNAYVAAAKKLVYGVCGIDMIAGPSEILVIADEGANPNCVAADMLSQAEHDKLASAVLITNSLSLANSVAKCLNTRCNNLLRSDIAKESIINNGKIIVVDSIDKAIELSNAYAPEHLELCVSNPFDYLEKVKNAGSIFMGYTTPEAVGDYYAGANHTLPTSGTARFSSPLGVEDFLKITQYIYYNPAALYAASADIVQFARSEGLTAHAESVSVRIKNE
ncbi:MAG: histidinol dehydrogenase [Clostridiales bacterium]|nr:histidinol dehydrogenase [Clostridiales bacterium]